MVYMMIIFSKPYFIKVKISCEHLSTSSSNMVIDRSTIINEEDYDFYKE